MWTSASSYAEVSLPIVKFSGFMTPFLVICKIYPWDFNSEPQLTECAHAQHVTQVDSSFRGQVNNSQLVHETQWNKPSDKLKCHWDTQARNLLVRLVGYSWVIPSWCTRGSLRRQGASPAPELEPGARWRPALSSVQRKGNGTLHHRANYEETNNLKETGKREKSGHSYEAKCAEVSGHGSQDTRLTFQVYSSLWKYQVTFRNSKKNCFKTF